MNYVRFVAGGVEYVTMEEALRAVNGNLRKITQIVKNIKEPTKDAGKCRRFLGTKWKK